MSSKAETEPTTNLDDFLLNTIVPLLDQPELPNTRRYTLQKQSSEGQARTNVHKDAINDTGAEPGDVIKQAYIRELNIVILDLNPQEA
jgi:hypothetical protein